MKKKYLFKSLFCAMAALALSISCNKENESTNSGGNDDGTTESTVSKYVVAVSTTDGADYLLYTDQLGSEDLSVLGSGVETDLTSAQWYFYKNSRVFGLKYNDGDPVPMETYEMGDTKPVLGLEYESYRFTTYGTWGDEVVTSASNSWTNSSTGVYEPFYGTEVYPRYMQIARYDSKTGIAKYSDFEADNYLGTGEYVNFAGFAESDGNLYVSVYAMGATAYGTTKYSSDFESTSTSYYGSSAEYLNYVSSGWGGSGSGSFKPGEIPTTPFPNQFHVAIFQDGDDLSTAKPTVITDDRMSPACGRQSSTQYPTIHADDDENIYIFSPGNERIYAGAGVVLYSDDTKETVKQHADLNNNVIGDGLLYKSAGTHSASVMRIKKGATSLDESYGVNGVFDVESAMGNRSFLTCYHIDGSGSKFLVQAYNDANVQYTSGVNYKYYIVDAAAQTAIAVTGQPEPTTISAVSRNPFFEDGKAYVGITSTENSSPVLYEIDSTTGVAKNIANVNCSAILSVGKLAKN
ncbi:MAG: DUF4374 domain-containing protein [Rikenellaceae bacterium]